VVLAIPGQTVGELLRQSSETKDLNQRSAGWTFARIMLPEGLSAIETVEQWEKRPRWIVVFIGANDLLASFGIVGQARPTGVETFRAHYTEVTARLRATMAPDSPAKQLIVATLPDVTLLPFLQELPVSADNGSGERYPKGSKASAFLIPFRTHFEAEEVYTPAELDSVGQRAVDFNAAIVDIARAGGFTVIDMVKMSEQLESDAAFSSPDSPYFSPDLHHPSYRTHQIIAHTVLKTMASIADAPAPDTVAAADTPLPSAKDLHPDRDRVNALMHLAMQGLELGPLPRKVTFRSSLDGGGQGGEERVGVGVISAMVGVEALPIPVTSHQLMRLCGHARAAIAAFEESEETDFFPERGLEGRLGLAFEPIAGWTWRRFELGGLITPDDAVDFGVYGRLEWRMLYAEASSRGWLFDRFEVGVSLQRRFGRPGRNGN
jgi:GDSL-like Lipase/Acylhydrolase